MSKNMKKIIALVCVVFNAGLNGSSFYNAISKGDTNQVHELIKASTKIDVADVALAALKGQVDVVLLFVQKGAPLDTEAIRCAVRGACENKKSCKAYEEIVHILLKAYAPFDKETLEMAVTCGNMPIVRMLVQAMPDFNSTKPANRSSLNRAS